MLREVLKRGIKTALGHISPGAKPRSGKIPIDLAGVKGEVEPGTTILDACTRLGVELEHCCGGAATCGTCRVTVSRGLDQLSKIAHKEEAMLDSVRESPADRLGCQAHILGPVKITIPEDWRGV